MARNEKVQVSVTTLSSQVSPEKGIKLKKQYVFDGSHMKDDSEVEIAPHATEIPRKKRKLRGISDHPKTSLGRIPSNLPHTAENIPSVGLYESYQLPQTPTKKKRRTNPDVKKRDLTANINKIDPMVVKARATAYLPETSVGGTSVYLGPVGGALKNRPTGLHTGGGFKEYVQPLNAT